MAEFRSPLRRQSRRKHSLAGWWAWWRAPIFLLLIMAVWWFILKPATEGDDWASPSQQLRSPLNFGLCGEKGAGRACVVDGDTLHIRRGNAAQRIRITGYNAPELDGACEAEKRQAQAAKRVLHAWLADGTYEWDGGDEPPYDQYGRELRALRKPDGKGGYDLLEKHMLNSGMGAESGWSSAQKDWCE